MLVDLRSDTVTKPSDQMRVVMSRADVGDDVYQEDPSIKRLEDSAASLLGHEAGLFVASGTQSNLCALLSHCERGDEYIAGQMAHTYRFEAGGAAALGGIQPQPLIFREDGTLDIEEIADAIKPDNFHFAKTRLLCLENTNQGRAIPSSYFANVRKLTERNNLSLHLDGARLFNAAIANEVEAKEYAKYCDSVSICLSKGLGAPVGSVLVGQKYFIDDARRWRKMLGGGMRQAGILAAAGQYALDKNRERLALDHLRAEQLAVGLSAMLGSEAVTCATNMVFIKCSNITDIQEKLQKQHVLISGARLVVHLDISDKDIEHVLTAFSQIGSTS